MSKLIHIIAISGSTREVSVNLNLIQAISQLYKNKLNLSVFQNIAGLPHFNPDWDNDNSPEIVNEFRAQLRTSDGILICTPEYAMGVPGTLKNAIDWTVSSMEFYHKPTALITAGLSGLKGHKALMETLNIIEANIPESSQLIIPFAKTKIKGDVITDEQTKLEIIRAVDSLVYIINQKME